MPLNEQIKELIRKTLSKKESVYFSGNKLPIIFQTRINELDDDSLRLKNAVAPQYIHDLVKSEHFTLQVDTVRFEASEISSDGEQIIFPIVNTFDIQDIRREQRFAFTPQEKVICEILNPYDEQTVVKREVIEVSASGLSIRNPYLSKLFAADTQLPMLQVYINGEHYLSQSGIVVYSRQLMNLKGESFFQTGIKFY